MLPLHTILCPIDFSAPSKAALMIAAELADKFSAALYVLHVLELAPLERFRVPLAGSTARHHREELKAMAQRNLEDAIGGLDPRPPHIELLIETGVPAERIMAVADMKQADIIVIATRGTSGIERLMFGSVAEAVVRRARCPVLSINTPRN